MRYQLAIASVIALTTTPVLAGSNQPTGQPINFAANADCLKFVVGATHYAVPAVGPNAVNRESRLFVLGLPNVVVKIKLPSEAGFGPPLTDKVTCGSSVEFYNALVIDENVPQ